MYLNWTKGTGSFSVDSSKAYNHVNASTWLFTTTPGNFIEAGYWAAIPGTTYLSQRLNKCNYSIASVNNNQTGVCLSHVTTIPASTSYEIEASAPGSQLFYVYVNGTLKAQWNVGVAHSNLVAAGYEEQDDSLPSPQLSPVSTFGSLSYRNAAGSFQNWGTHTHCATDYDLGESFGRVTYPTAFKAQIGPSAGPYSGCDNSVPTSVRTTW